MLCYKVAFIEVAIKPATADALQTMARELPAAVQAGQEIQMDVTVFDKYGNQVWLNP